MEFIQHPELKSKYAKCKYKVKRWEYNFKKKYGRVPSKLDIREADKEVRDAYRIYFKLKLDALSESFVGIDGFNSDEEREVEELKEELNHKNSNVKETEETLVAAEDKWGEHLNKKPVISDININTTDERVEFNSNITKKLFTGSKFSKRNPRKSLSFSQKKSAKDNKPNFLSQPSTSTSSEEITPEFEKCISKDDLFGHEEITFISDKAKMVSTQSLNMVQGILENKVKPLRTLDYGWVARSAKDSGVEVDSSINSNEGAYNFSQPVEYSDSNQVCDDSDEIIDDSDDDNSSNVLHIAKKLKLDSVISTSELSSAHSGNNVASSTNLEKESNETDNNQCANKLNDIYNFDEGSDKKKSVPNRRTSRQIRTRINLKEIDTDTEEQDPYATDNDSDDPEFDFSEKKKPNKLKYFIQPEQKENVKKIQNKKVPKKSKVSTKRGVKSKNRTEKGTEESKEEDIYELEYSVNPRIKSVPRVNNIKTLLKCTKKRNPDIIKNDSSKASGDKIKDKREQIKKQFEEKIASGNLNENFVTINIKKKIFVRGKKSTNFSKMKKQQWRSKKKAKALCGPDMDMGGCDGGQLTCFNCGQVGHFARQCKETKGDKLLPLEAEEDCPYPTLQEASQMASNTANLTIRAPKLLTEETEKSGDDELHKNVENDLFSSDDEQLLLAETLKLEEFSKIDMTRYLDDKKIIDPVYETNGDGSILSTPAEVFEALQKFGHSSFRPGQELAIMRILSGKSTLVTLSTGSGKSLCYQLPAYLYSQKQACITLVVSPLVSLMEDQVTGIPSFLKAACLHTNQTKVQREKVMQLIESGNLDVLLVSPEAVVTGERSAGFGSIMRKLPPIAFACVDEAHCVSQWSHNFRPSYLMLCRVLRDRLGVNTILGLTATATRATSDSIIKHFNIADGRDGIIQDVPVPDNICLTISKDTQRDQALVGLLLSERFLGCKSIIVYCTRRDECERLAAYLRTCLKYHALPDPSNKKRKRVDVQAEPYHAGMAASRRRTVQKAFMSGELKIVVATVAFGMGINKSDIRAVIHYNMPKSFESYVQEIGRAGRDGLPAHCHLFLDFQGRDNRELQRHVHANSMDRHVIRKLLQKIFIPCTCAHTCSRHEVAFSIAETVLALDVPEENLSTLLCYLELHENRYIEVLSPAYVTCKVISYSGPNQIRKAAKDCPPLAMALVLYKNDKDENVLEFPVVDVAAAIGWDSGICKHKLKNLEWNTVNNQPKRSTLTVQFSNLGFRLLAPGNLTDTQLDDALDTLFNRVVDQEKTALLQLQAIHTALTEVAEKSYRTCITADQHDCSNSLKTKIREYFESPNPLENVPELVDPREMNEEKIVSDVRALVGMYRDNVFTGRAVARIFHGIQSPNYPAVIWGRCKFWRTHVDADFNSICKIATREILKMK